MSRRTLSLVGRLPLAATSHTRITTYASRQFSITSRQQSQEPKASSSSPTQPNTTSPAPKFDSPATYTSIVSHSSSSTLTTSLTPREQAKLTNAGHFFRKNPQFLYSAAQFKHHPFNEQVPEVVVLGASNVGKSTFLNALVGRPGIARTSPRPGHTVFMNAYGLGPVPHVARDSIKKGTPVPRHSLIAMDTPGYGYRSQSTWGGTIVRYLGARKTLKGAVVLLSAEKRLMPEDRWLLEALADANVRTVVVVTKADKLRRRAGEGGQDGKGWAEQCSDKAAAIRAELTRIQKGTGRDWKEDAGWSSDVFITAAGAGHAGKANNMAGMGAVRAAILDMAGFQVAEDVVEQKPDNISYTGEVVPFDDIVWKK